MLPVLALALALHPAHATEVGNGKDFGIGVALGVGAAFTGKWWFGPHNGFAFHVGSGYGNWVGGQVQWEGDIVQFVDWPFANFNMYWDAGITSYMWTWSHNEGLTVGGTGGIGVDLRFHKVPAAVFLETDAHVMPIALGDAEPVWFDVYGVTGGRWYF